MDPIARLKAELEAKKRKLGEAAADADGSGAGADAAGQTPKKKVYRTNGQTKQLIKGMQVSVSSASGHQDGAEGPLSPEQNGHELISMENLTVPPATVHDSFAVGEITPSWRKMSVVTLSSDEPSKVV